MILYHYCSVNNFENILNSKKLWLTPIKSMNDRTEIDHLYNNVWPCVKEILLRNINPNYIKFLKEIIEIVDRESKLHVASFPYCACFSDDGDLLSQWRSYSQDATGISIGFNSEYFKIQNQLPHPNTKIENAIGIDTVIYDFSVQVNGLSQVMKQVIEPKNSYCWVAILKNLTRYSAIFKNHTFFSEQEKRIIYYSDKSHLDQFSGYNLTGPYEYVKDNVMYSRFELSWYQSRSNHAIANIILGPKCKYDRGELMQMLDNFNIQLEEQQIHKSLSTYR
jgi:hypothetical protein